MLPLHGIQTVSLFLSVSCLLSCEISYIVISNGVRRRLTSPLLALRRLGVGPGHMQSICGTQAGSIFYFLSLPSLFTRDLNLIFRSHRKGDTTAVRQCVCVCVCVGLFVLAQARMFCWCWCWGCCRVPVLCASIRSQVASEA